MAVAPFEIISGPGDVWLAPYGTAFPVINAAPISPWVALGRTEGGVTVRHTQSVELLMADQDTAPVKAIRSEDGMEIEFQLVELTLEKYRFAINNASVVTAAGPPAIKYIELWRGPEVTPHAIVVRGPSAYGNFNCQYQVPMVVQTEEPEVSFVRDDKAVLNSVFTALADLASPSSRFGRLIHQTA
ncbi:MAG: hypothetical protein H0U46_09100 [Actinobacteria bacterium]|nr:hypothetical protein [Actinomycetota bacterium]